MAMIQCPQCGTEYDVPDDWEGRKAQCQNCSTRFRIPQKQSPVITLADDSSGSSGSKIVISFDDVVSPTASAPAARNLSPRQRRLLADSQMMHLRFSTFPYIHLVEAVGNPPEKYIVDYFVKGIERLEGQNPVFRSNHRVEIKLPGTYPRTPPLCRMLTPIFHPNIEPAVICIGDHWSAGERLCDLVIRIGEIITYQSYNIKSPLDGEAAMWADLHEDMLPIDNSDLFPPEN